MSSIGFEKTAKFESDAAIRPTRIVIDLDVLTENYRAIQSAVGQRKVMAVLKANAYGHGLIEIGRHFESLGVPYFSVAYLEEAIELRKQGSKRQFWFLAD